MENTKSIAFIATGDELIFGDVVNTNSQLMAQILTDEGFSIGTHLVVGDDEAEIQKAINYLKQEHHAIILIGGLGPTSDDRTRFALAKALNLELEFDSTSWDAIIQRLNRYNVVPHESNRQQAYFPKGSLIWPNLNGTANACFLAHENHFYFMLPGPPSECMPIFHQHVVPFLQEKFLEQSFYHLRWRLFGVSEAEIAAKLDQALKDVPCFTAYRWNYPYLDFKVRTLEQNCLETIISKVEPLVNSHIICSAKQTASEELKINLSEKPLKIYINDRATHGYLSYYFSQYEFASAIQFIDQKPQSIDVNELFIGLQGLDELLQKDLAYSVSELTIHMVDHLQEKSLVRKIPYRNRHIVRYVLEYLCYLINEKIK